MSSEAITKNDLAAIFSEMGTLMMLDMFYPVGSYYETSDTSFNPNYAWGGTWVLETEGIVHVSAGTNYPINHADDNNGVGTKDGGETTHKLTVAELASHSHSPSVPTNSDTGFAGIRSISGRSGTLTFAPATSSTGTRYGFASNNTYSDVAVGRNTATAGSNTPHNNMQPYIIVNRWHRTA